MPSRENNQAGGGSISTLRATALVAFFTIFAKILSAVKDGVLAHQFGAKIELDIYVAAFRPPDLFYNLLILGTLSVAFIPVFISYLDRRGEAYEIADTIFNLTLLVMGALALFGFLAAPLLVPLIVPGFSGAAREQTVGLARIMMLSPLLFSLSSILTGILHSHKRFFLAALAPIVYSLSVIAAVLFFYPRFGLPGLAWGVVLGALLHFLLQLPSVWRLGWRPFRHLNLRHRAVVKIIKLYLPRIFGIELGQVSLLAASVIGSFLGAGSLAVIYFAYNLETVPLGVVALSFAIAAFPTMAGYFAKDDLIGLRDFLAKTMVQIFFLVIPISVLMFLLRAQIVRLILGAGQNTQFDFAATKLVARALGFFVLSLVAQSLVPLLARAFYAMHNTVVPVAVGLVATVVDVVLAVGLTRILGIDAIALAFSAAATAQALLLFIVLRKRLGRELADEYLLLRGVKIVIASLVMGIAAYLTLYAVAPLVNMQTYLGVLVQTVSAAMVAAASYLAVGLLIKLPETRELLAILKTWLTKINVFTDLG